MQVPQEGTHLPLREVPLDPTVWMVTGSWGSQETSGGET